MLAKYANLILENNLKLFIGKVCSLGLFPHGTEDSV